MLQPLVLFLAAAIVLLAGSALHSQQAPETVKPIPMHGVPLPSDAKILPPSKDIPADEASFSGEWFGMWDDLLPGILVVEEILPDHSAVVVYAWGVGGQIRSPGYGRMVGLLTAGELRLPRFSNGAIVTYQKNADGTLHGTYTTSSGKSRIVMKPVIIPK